MGTNITFPATDSLRQGTSQTPAPDPRITAISFKPGYEPSQPIHPVDGSAVMIGGRISKFHEIWEAMSNYAWTLDSIREGVRLDFSSEPIQAGLVSGGPC